MSRVAVLARFAKAVHVVSGGQDSEHIAGAGIGTEDSRGDTPSRDDEVCSFCLGTNTAVVAGSNGIVE